MKIIIEKKITVDPENGQGQSNIVVAYEEIMEASSKDENTVLSMIDIGSVAMEKESKEAMVLEVSKIVKAIGA